MLAIDRAIELGWSVSDKSSRAQSINQSINQSIHLEESEERNGS